ncbi:MAG: HD domain-containing phosphohydrolase [Alphaproteobacteria bacterium]
MNERIKGRVLAKSRLGLQFSIVLLVVAVVVTMAVAMAAGVLFASTQAAEDGARRQFEEISARIVDRIDRQIGDMIELAGLGASLAAAAEPVRGDAMDHPLTPFLVRSLKQAPDLYAVYVGHADGAFLQAIAVNGNRRILASNKAPEGTSVILRAISVGDDGNRREHRTFLDGTSRILGADVIQPVEYDPRSRSWYTSVLATEGAVLSEPYVFASLQAPGLTVSQRVGGTTAVIGVNISLTGLSDFLARQDISPNGGAVLLDAKRRVMALSPALLPSPGGRFEPLAGIDGLGLPLLSALTPGLVVDRAQIVPTSRGSALVHWSRWTSRDGQSIGVGIVSPFADFTGPIDDMQRRILLITMAILLVVLPISFAFSRAIARSVRHLMTEAARIRDFSFSEIKPRASFIKEFHELGEVFALMEETIATRTDEVERTRHQLVQLVELGIALSAERDSGRLMDMILGGAKELTNADGGTLYMREENRLRFQILRNDSLGVSMGGVGEASPTLPPVPLFGDDGVANHHNVVSHAVHEQATVNIADAYDNAEFDFSGTRAFDQRSGYRSTSFLTVPLKPRGGEVIGALQLINARMAGSSTVVPFSTENQRFVEALAAQAATALYNRELLDAQERLMDAMIQIIAGAIDAKSPYTGGHCERVPELSLMLAEEAGRVSEGSLASFRFDSPDEWREFRIGAWLHDCGKVTTPEFVVDKASKLETIYNRIHEVRTRFEVLLRDARISMLEAIAGGTSPAEAEAAYEAEKAILTDDFAFLAECNLGGEFMAPDKLERLKSIATRTWMRHFDDRLGLAHDELGRYPGPPLPLPVQEALLADKPYHVIPRTSDSAMFDARYGFKIRIPEHLYNLGELYNLSIGRGTLTEEERFKVNEHSIQTILMLERLPFPKNLLRVSEYAGAHHETLIGTGYPRQLDAGGLSIPARIIAISDIFEALTASDRPYKKPKTLSESVKILSFFKKDKHIDPDLFDLFLTSGVYRRYAERYLLPEQMDEVDISRYVG